MFFITCLWITQLFHLLWKQTADDYWTTLVLGIFFISLSLGLNVRLVYNFHHAKSKVLIYCIYSIDIVSGLFNSTYCSCMNADTARCLVHIFLSINQSWVNFPCLIYHSAFISWHHLTEMQQYWRELLIFPHRHHVNAWKSKQAGLCCYAKPEGK